MTITSHHDKFESTSRPQRVATVLGKLSTRFEIYVTDPRAEHGIRTAAEQLLGKNIADLDEALGDSMDITKTDTGIRLLAEHTDNQRGTTTDVVTISRATPDSYPWVQFNRSIKHDDNQPPTVYTYDSQTVAPAENTLDPGTVRNMLQQVADQTVREARHI